MITLDQLPLGSSAEILAIKESSLTAKLTDMGLYPGKKVKLLFKAPLGDPIAIDVEGYTLGLRLEEAALIQVVNRDLPTSNRKKPAKKTSLLAE